MWEYGMLAVYFVTVEGFTALWYCRRKPSALGLTAGLGAVLLARLGMEYVLAPAAVPAALLAGFLVCQLGFERKDGPILPGLMACVGAAVPPVPLGLSSGDWQIGFFTGLLLLLLLMGLSDRLLDREKDWEPFRGETVRYQGWIYLPLGLVPVGAALLLVSAPLSPIRAAILWGMLLAVGLGLIWTQDLLCRARYYQDMNGILQQWHRESRDYMNTIRSQRHDFNLHLHAISGLISGGEYTECGAYVQKLVSDAAAVNDIMPVSDAVVGSMLYNMREQARRKGSDILYTITYDMADLVCNGFECNKILGNLLQNAIDALQTPEDRAYGIRVRIFKRRGNTVATVENRFTGDPGEIARAFEAGRSTKKHHEGIGLTMVLRTVERYGGRVYPEFEDGVIRFVVNIPNRVNLGGEEEECASEH